MGIRLLLILLLAGCSATVNLPAGQPTKLCAPADLPDPALWRLLEAKPFILTTEDGRPLVGIKAIHTVQGHVLSVIWIDGLLALVDPAPDDYHATMWIDGQVLVHRGGDLYAMSAPRWQSCEWREYRLSERT